jgi:hypothetical protein
VIQNSNTEEGAILAITNLRATNLTTAPVNGGILPVAQQEVTAMMDDFTAYLQEKQNAESDPQPSDPEEYIPSAQEQAQANAQMADILFTSVRQWLDAE